MMNKSSEKFTEKYLNSKIYKWYTIDTHLNASWEHQIINLILCYVAIEYNNRINRFTQLQIFVQYNLHMLKMYLDQIKLWMLMNMTHFVVQSNIYMQGNICCTYLYKCRFLLYLYKHSPSLCIYMYLLNIFFLSSRRCGEKNVGEITNKFTAEFLVKG